MTFVRVITSGDGRPRGWKDEVSVSANGDGLASPISSKLNSTIRSGMRSDFAKNSIVVFVALIVASALNYGFYLAVGHTLSVADYGSVISLVSLLSLVTTPAAIGQTIVAKVVAHRAIVGLGRVPDDILKRTFGAAAVAALIIAAAGYVGRGQIAHYLHLERADDVVVTSVATALGIPLFLGRGLLQGAQLFRAFAISNVIDGALRLGLGLLLAARFGVGGALTATALAIGASVVYGAGVALGARERPSSAAVPQSLPAAITATASISFVMIALGYYDPILVKHYLSATDAGVYGVLSLAGRAVGIVLSFVPIVLLPNVAKHAALGTSSRTILAASLGVCVAFATVATLTCAVAAPLLVHVLAGASFQRAGPFLTMYIAAASLLGIAAVAAAYLIGRHDFRSVVPLSIVAAGEVAAVSLRHSSISDVVQDVLIGHAAVAAVMLLSIGLHAKTAPNRLLVQLAQPS